MSSKLHDKWHRKNHHTYTSSTAPDAGHDPIASPREPFTGDFHLSGMLSAYAPLSASAGAFRSNHVGVSAMGTEVGAYVQGLSGITVFATGTETHNPTGDLDQAALYCYADANDPGTFGNIEYVLGYIPKALICDGYGEFRWPVYMHSLYSPYINATSIRTDNLITPLLTATDASFISLTADTFYVTTLVSTSTATSTTTASDFFTPSLTATNIYAGYVETSAHAAVAIMPLSSAVVPQNTWTLIPATTARYDPYTWFTGFGTIKPNKRGICLCEMAAIAHPLSGTSLGITASVITNTTFNNLTANPDDLQAPFHGAWFDNNGVTFTGSPGVSGVAFQGTTLIDVDGTTDEIGVYVYNGSGQTVVDYMRLRVVHLGYKIV
jgi:hypothetical protein